MAKSLQDQLLGMGLSNQQKARKINSAKKKAVKKSRKDNEELKNEAAELADKVREQQRLKSQKLNAEHHQEMEQKAIVAQIRQIIEMNSIAKGKDDKATQAYNFNDNKTIKTIYVSAKNHDLISRGRVAIAKLEQSYHLIPVEAAKKINERNNGFIVLLNDALKQEKGQDVDDDPYADYQIPDDLMW